MSLTADIIAYLTDTGHVDEVTWKSNAGSQHRTKEAHDTLVIVEDAMMTLQDTHGGENRSLGFRLRVRHGQHRYEECRTKFFQVYDALQDKVTEINAAVALSPDPGPYALVHCDAGGPIVFWDSKDRPNMSSVFRVICSKAV